MEQPSLFAFIAFDQFIGHQTIRRTMYGVDRLFGRRFDEAKDLARTFVEPVAQVFDAVLLLRLELSLVSVGNRVSSPALDAQ